MTAHLPPPVRPAHSVRPDLTDVIQPALRVPRVREQAREALALMAFSAVASTTLAALLLWLALISR